MCKFGSWGGARRHSAAHVCDRVDSRFGGGKMLRDLLNVDAQRVRNFVTLYYEDGHFAIVVGVRQGRGGASRKKS